MGRKIEFENAQKRASENTTTFKVPSWEELNGIASGSIVKVCHNKERFWAEVEYVKGDAITATINNTLVREQPFSFGDRINFKKENVYKIFEPFEG